MVLDILESVEIPMSTKSGEEKLRARVGMLQKKLDESARSEKEAYRQLQMIQRELDNIGEAIRSYPDQLPQNVEEGLTDGQYRYLLDCLRAGLGYQVNRIDRLMVGWSGFGER
jgi:hypothetical protein